MWGISRIRCFQKTIKDTEFLGVTSDFNKIFPIFASNLNLMKKLILTLLVCLTTTLAMAGNVLNEGFEYANHDLEKPVGWNCDDNSWLCGYLEKDHSRMPHTGNWYAFSNAQDSWMYMPMYLIENMKYRFTLWAITDGSFQFEIWAGSAPHPDDMHTQFFSTTIEGGEYERFSAFVETIPPDCHYIGIRAIGDNRDTYLTIDDIEIDMVEQYSFEAEPITGDTSMYPGTQAVFHYLVHNTGYDPVDVSMHPSNEYFTDFSCYANGVSGMTIATQPDETVEVTIYATLRPEVEPGTVAWLDIIMTIPCNCNTAMVTFWVTPLDPTGISESNMPIVSVFPNPTIDFVTVEAEDLRHVNVFDETGKMIKSVPANGNALQLDLSGLKPGVYFISASTRATSSFVKPILKM